MKVPVPVQCIALLTAIAAVYGESAGHGFVMFDDYNEIVRNGAFRKVTVGGVVELFTDPVPFLYYSPIKYLTYLLTYGVRMRLDPALFHLGNVLIHMLAALLAYAFSLALTKRSAIAFPASLLFAIHPAQSAAVNHISSRGHLLAALFAFAALWFYLLARERGRSGARSSAGWPLLALSWLAFAMGLLSYPTILPVPVTILALELFSPTAAGALGPRLRNALRCVLPFLALGLLFVLANNSAHASSVLIPLWKTYGLFGSYRFFDFLHGYIQATFWPTRHDLGTAIALSPHIFSLPFLFHLSVPAAVLYAAWKLSRAQRWVITAATLFFAQLAPHAALLYPARMFPMHMVAQRYVYLPSLGLYLMLCAAMVVLIERLSAYSPGAARAAAAAALVAALLLGINCRERTRVWESTRTLQGSLTAQEKLFAPESLLSMAVMERHEGQVAEAACLLEQAAASAALLRKSADSAYLDSVEQKIQRFAARSGLTPAHCAEMDPQNASGLNLQTSAQQSFPMAKLP